MMMYIKEENIAKDFILHEKRRKLLQLTMAQTDPRPQQEPNRVYEDFEPSYEWAQDEESDTLILMLKELRRENLMVQLSRNRILKLRGEQEMSENKWRRFNKEFSIPPHSNTNGIKAKFEGGLLYIMLPKNSITEVKPATQSATPNLKADENQKRLRENKTKTKPESSQEPKTSDVSQTKEMEKARKIDKRIDGLGNGKGEKKVNQRLPRKLYGLVGEVVKQKKLPNLLVVILLFLGMGMYVKNAIKSSFGGSI